MVFTSNHDENSWKGSVFERYGKSAKTFAVLCGVIKGIPLIYSGQEAGMNKSLRFFDKDTINWRTSDFREIYTKLNDLKKVNKALWNGNYGGEMIMIKSDKEKSVFAFTREKDGNKVVAIFNLSLNELEFNLESASLLGKVSRPIFRKTCFLKGQSNEIKTMGFPGLL